MPGTGLRSLVSGDVVALCQALHHAYTSSMSTKQWRWVMLLAWMGAIFYVSGTPSNEIPDFGIVDLLVKKGSHALAYAILAVLAYRATGSNRTALLIAVLYAISDETHQLFVPGRNGQPLDVLIDAVGAVLGLWGYGMVTRPRSPQGISPMDDPPRS